MGYLPKILENKVLIIGIPVALNQLASPWLSLFQIKYHNATIGGKTHLGFFAHGKNMAQWQFWSVVWCPHCNTKVKDKAHIMQCPSVDTQQTWSQSLQALQQWFWSSNMAHKIAEAIIWGFNEWRNPSKATAPPDVACIKDQEALEWDHFMDGWLACSWQTYQESVWHSFRGWWSSWWWVAKLVKKIWNVSWDMLVHCNGIMHNSTQAKQAILEKKSMIKSVLSTKPGLMHCHVMP